MRLELDNLLCEQFPLLYRDRHGDPRQTLMCFGFDIDDGWFNILYMLSSGLEKLIQSYPLFLSDLRAVQVKEKFGGLRFYISGYPSEPVLNELVENLISSAEYLAWKTCEMCGAPGVSRSGGWIKTLCDYHVENRYKKKDVTP